MHQFGWRNLLMSMEESGNVVIYLLLLKSIALFGVFCYTQQEMSVSEN